MTNFQPPKNFKTKPAGDVLWAKISNTEPPFLNRKKRRGSRAKGIKYEAKVHEHFTSCYGLSYLPSPWLLFQEVEQTKPRWCQPDGLIIRPERGVITIVEMKFQHTIDAWWQLYHLYAPVLASVFPSPLWSIRVCEVVRWYDPSVIFPQLVRLVREPELTSPKDFGVHIWKP